MTEFLSEKKGLISMAQLFEGGTLITENLHSVTIKPTSQEKIDAMLRCAEAEWDKTYQEALEIYRTNKHKDKYKWVWLGLCVFLMLTRKVGICSFAKQVLSLHHNITSFCWSFRLSANDS